MLPAALLSTCEPTRRAKHNTKRAQHIVAIGGFATSEQCLGNELTASLAAAAGGASLVQRIGNLAVNPACTDALWQTMAYAASTLFWSEYDIMAHMHAHSRPHCNIVTDMKGNGHRTSEGSVPSCGSLCVASLCAPGPCSTYDKSTAARASTPSLALPTMSPDHHTCYQGCKGWHALRAG